VKTLIIKREEVAKVLTPSEAIRAVQKAFKAHGLRQADMPAKTYLTCKKGDLRAMPAYVHGRGLDIAGIKSVSVHPENRRYKLPTVMGVTILTDPRNRFMTGRLFLVGGYGCLASSCFAWVSFASV
jgi:ornithine cyclodeaminase/alanine dehydrogenase-like protein (mu-crystallin family)